MLPVYVIHWQRPQWCAQAVASIRASTGIELTVTVIDQASDPPLELEDADRIIRLPRNVGYTGGANVALDDWLAGEEPFCVVAAHDLLVAPDALALLVATASAVPSAGVLGPEYEGMTYQSGGGALLGHDDGVNWQEWVSGACLMLRRACVQQVGPFDEDYGSYYEDIDYCYRARAHGWQVGSVTGARARGLGSTAGHKVHGPVNGVVFAWKHGAPGDVTKSRVVLAKKAAWRLVHGQPRRAFSQLAAIPLSMKRIRELRARGEKREAR